jgi:hypothetical protein
MPLPLRAPMIADCVQATRDCSVTVLRAQGICSVRRSNLSVGDVEDGREIEERP